MPPPPSCRSWYPGQGRRYGGLERLGIGVMSDRLQATSASTAKDMGVSEARRPLSTKLFFFDSEAAALRLSARRKSVLIPRCKVERADRQFDSEADRFSEGTNPFNMSGRDALGSGHLPQAIAVARPIFNERFVWKGMVPFY